MFPDQQVAAPTPDSFRAQFPGTQFDVTDDEIIAAGNVAITIHAINALAVLYLTAHLLATADAQTGKPDGGSGEVLSEMIGPKKYEYIAQAAQGDGQSFYTTTSYGRHFLVLESRAPARVFSARVAG